MAITHLIVGKNKRGIGQKILHIWAKIFAFYAFMGRAWEGKGGVMRGAVVYCFL